MNIRTKQNADEYRTSDIYLSAYLIAGKFAELAGIESSGTRRKTFVLFPAPSQEQIQSFYSRSDGSRIIARDVLEELRNLKGMILNQESLQEGGSHE